MEKSILKIMIQEHNRINNMLMEFEKQTQDNLEKSKEIFIKFKLNLEKHFSFEEKFIFSIYTAKTREKDSDIYNIIFDLIREHKDMKKLSVDIENAVTNNKNPDISDMIKISTHHIKTENEIFYPKLDKELTEEQKQEIIFSAQEIILG